MSTFLEEHPVEVEPVLTTKAAPQRWGYVPTLWLVGWLAVAGGFLLQNWTRKLATPAAAREVASAGAKERKFESRAIKDIRTGMRVIADNPELNGQDVVPSDINPQTWRNIRFRMKKPDDGELLITLLRPLEWLEERQGEVGRDVHLNLEELGVAAPATILAIEPCPEIESGDGRVVTGTFQHSAANVIDLYVTDDDEPIGTTANHPFWSETRQKFVQAGLLEPGEELRTATGARTLVLGLFPRSGLQSVFNFEVDAEHVYAVGNSAITVHNSQSYSAPIHWQTSDVALGVRENLSQFAHSVRGSTYRQWAAHGFTRRSVEGTRFGAAFTEATRRAEKIHFNLDGIDDPVTAVRLGRSGFDYINVTNYTNTELNIIKNTPELLRKTIFYRNGQVEPNPF